MTSVVRFAITGGSSGVDQLATRLKAMETAAVIGAWNVGTWVDPTHQSIRIWSDSYGDSKPEKYACATCPLRSRMMYPPPTGQIVNILKNRTAARQKSGAAPATSVPVIE